jgi:hypothetical protein
VARGWLDCLILLIVLLGVLWIVTVWPDRLMLFIILLGLSLGGQRLARPTDAVDRVLRSLAEWPEASQTDTVLLIIWLGIWQCGQKLVGLGPAVLSSEWCGEIEISCLVGW